MLLLVCSLTQADIKGKVVAVTESAWRHFYNGGVQTFRKENMKNCECGCGEKAGGGDFLPGYDQKLRITLEKEAGGLLALRELVRGDKQ